MDILKRETKSLCNICFRQISASIYSEGRKVTMRKKCPDHGKFESLIENDVNCYRALAHIKKRGNDYFHTLTFPFTYRCNFNCEFCYLPDRRKKDLELGDIKKIIKNFKGSFIGISGGEPTLRDELTEIIKFIYENDKMSVLYTNGLALEDINYLRRLKKAGLNRILFSFDGFDSKVYRLIKISNNFESVVEKKLRALENLKKEKIPTILSMTIYGGINESEIKKTFEFAVRNNSFIYELRIRSCSKIGKFRENIGAYFMSDLLRMFEDATKIKTYTSLKDYLCRYAYYTPHSVDLKLYFCRVKGNIKILLFLAKLINDITFFIFKLVSYIGVERIFKRIAYRLTRERPFIKHMILHFAVWPSVENIDLGELKAGVAHLYNGKILNFCHAVVLNKEL